jgi:NADH-quinone oxidoreductase subunit N
MDAGALNFSILAPIGFVAIGALLALVGDAWLSRGNAHVTPWLVLICSAALALAIFTAGSTFGAGTTAVFNPAHAMLRIDPFSSFVITLISLGALLSIWLSMSYLPALHIDHGEYYALLMLSVVGMFVMVASIDMMTVYIGLELMSIPVYVLAGFDRRKLRSNESGLKSFLAGAFASAVLLYGTALLYGATGATSFEGIRAGFDAARPLALSGLALVIVGLAFKVAAVPFHQWVPDVYEGAPTSVSGFISVAVKIAAFAVLVRFLMLAQPEASADVRIVLAALAAATMVVGNVMAMIQTNLKRMLGYSGIAHAGYLLVAVAAGVGGSEGAWSAVLFYLFAYLFMNLGAFGLIAAMARGGREREHFEDFAGIARSRAGVAGLMTLFMLSLAGVPGTAGFMGKFYLFKSAVDADLVWLAVVAVLSSVVSLYTYLRLPVVMYMRESGPDVPGEVDTFAGIALAGCAMGVLWLGLLPNHSAFRVLETVELAAVGLAP